MEHITTHPRITAIPRPAVFQKSTFVIGLAVLGGITVLAGIVSLISAIILFSNTTLPTLAASILTDALLDILIGGLILVSSRAFAKGQILAIWLYGGSILLDSLYNLVKGYDLHYIFVGIGLLLIWQMLKFRQEWETL